MSTTDCRTWQWSWSRGDRWPSDLDGTPWPPRTAATLLIKLADAVEFAHERQVIHRDLKPANVLVTSEAGELEVKITDFGLAKFATQDSSQHTKSYAFLGTPSYMAPSKPGAAREVTRAADIYGLGAILYELLTGQPPFRGETPVETLRLLLSSEPVALLQLAPRTPRDLATICEKCLQPDPNRRYRSAGELREELTRYLEGKPIQRAHRQSRTGEALVSSQPAVVRGAGVGGVVAVEHRDGVAVVLGPAQQRAGEIAATSTGRTHGKRKRPAAAVGFLPQRGFRTQRQPKHGPAICRAGTGGQSNGILDTVGRSPQRELRLRNAVLAAIALPDMRKTRTIDVQQLAAVNCSLSLAAGVFAVATADGGIAGYRWSDGTRSGRSIMASHRSALCCRAVMNSWPRSTQTELE